MALRQRATLRHKPALRYKDRRFGKERRCGAFICVNHLGNGRRDTPTRGDQVPKGRLDPTKILSWNSNMQNNSNWLRQNETKCRLCKPVSTAVTIMMFSETATEHSRVHKRKMHTVLFFCVAILLCPMSIFFSRVDFGVSRKKGRNRGASVKGDLTR